MKFWQTSTFRGVVLAALATCLTYLIRDVTDGGVDWRDYALVWLGALLAVVNRARQDDIEGFPTITLGRRG